MLRRERRTPSPSTSGRHIARFDVRACPATEDVAARHGMRPLLQLELRPGRERRIVHACLRVDELREERRSTVEKPDAEIGSFGTDAEVREILATARVDRV